MRRLRFVLLVFALLPAPLQAQAGTDGTTAVKATIDRVFQGMATADSAMVRAEFAEGARFALLRTTPDSTHILYAPIDGWLRGIAGSGGGWREQLFDTVVQVDGDIASVWTGYNFYLDGKLRHCGTDSMELLRVAGAWKITQLSDTQRTEGCAERP
jgi:hypothetical protein